MTQGSTPAARTPHAARPAARSVGAGRGHVRSGGSRWRFDGHHARRSCACAVLRLAPGASSVSLGTSLIHELICVPPSLHCVPCELFVLHDSGCLSITQPHLPRHPATSCLTSTKITPVFYYDRRNCRVIVGEVRAFYAPVLDGARRVYCTSRVIAA